MEGNERMEEVFKREREGMRGWWKDLKLKENGRE